MPCSYYSVEEIPKTPNGKIDRLQFLSTSAPLKHASVNLEHFVEIFIDPVNKHDAKLFEESNIFYDGVQRRFLLSNEDVCYVQAVHKVSINIG